MEVKEKDQADADLDRKERRFSATCDGFDVHCAVRIDPIWEQTELHLEAA